MANRRNYRPYDLNAVAELRRSRPQGRVEPITKENAVRLRARYVTSAERSTPETGPNKSDSAD